MLSGQNSNHRLETNKPLEKPFGRGTIQKRPDVHKIVLSIKLRSPPPPRKSVNFEDSLLICTVFPHFGPFSRRGGKPNFADKNFMDTQTFLNYIAMLPPRAQDHLNETSASAGISNCSLETTVNRATTFQNPLDQGQSRVN